MKKLTILFFAFFATLSLSAQSEKSELSLKQNELSINLPLTIFGSFPEISYERILGTDISVGTSLGVGLSDNDYDMKFALTPHFRWFFGGSNSSMQKVAAGFFIEANGSLFTKRKDDTYDNDKKSQFGAGLGLAVGWKYVSRNNWVGDIFLGVGRDFVHSDEAYPRIGISIGKRF